MNPWGAFVIGLLLGYLFGYACLALMVMARENAWLRDATVKRDETRS